MKVEMNSSWKKDPLEGENSNSVSLANLFDSNLLFFGLLVYLWHRPAVEKLLSLHGVVLSLNGSFPLLLGGSWFQNGFNGGVPASKDAYVSSEWLPCIGSIYCCWRHVNAPLIFIAEPQCKSASPAPSPGLEDKEGGAWSHAPSLLAMHVCHALPVKKWEMLFCLCVVISSQDTEELFKQK